MALSVRASFAGLLFGAVPAVLLAGTWLVAKTAVDHLLYHDAVLTGENWTSYLVDNIKDLENIARGEKPSADSQAFLDRAEKAGQVFRYVIYDPEGRSRFVSDDLRKSLSEDEKAKPGEASNHDADKTNDDDDENLAEHNPAAARAIASGQPLINFMVGGPP